MLSSSTSVVYSEVKPLPHNRSASKSEAWDPHPGSRLRSWNAPLLLRLKGKKIRLVGRRIDELNEGWGQARERGSGEGSGRESLSVGFWFLGLCKPTFCPKVMLQYLYSLLVKVLDELWPLPGCREGSGLRVGGGATKAADNVKKNPSPRVDPSDWHV